MVKTSILSPLTFSRILFSTLVVVALGVVVNAQTVVRTNDGTQTATGTDVSLVQKADDYASKDVISVSGTSETNIAPFSTSVRVETSSNYTVTDFTVQSGTSDKQYIGAVDDARNYVLKLTNKKYDLTFKNVEFKYNQDPQDTFGIFLTMNVNGSTVKLNLDNASFTNFQAPGDSRQGGVIYTTGNLTINGTNVVSFSGNKTGSGGAIFASQAVTIDCDEIVFDSNACFNSGAIRHQGVLDITGSKVTFSNNSARNNGGAIYATNKIKMTGSGDTPVLTFSKNTATVDGGVIYSEGAEIDLNCKEIVFSENQAVNSGGAIRLNNANGKIKITGKTVSFDSNSATGTSGSGAVIYTNGAVEITGLSGAEYTFSNNNAKKDGGVIYANGSGIDINCNKIDFSNNQANTGGAIAYESTNTNNKVKITGETVTFNKNIAKSTNGGAIHTQASVELKGKSDDSVFTFSNNSSQTGNCGVMVVVGTVDISTGTFKFQNNSANGYGGAIESRKGITFSGDNTSATFTGNIAGSGNGNDIYLDNASVLTFKDSGTYYFDGGIHLVNTGASTVINKAQVTIAGRQYKPVINEGDPANVEDHTNNYQLQTVNISNGGKLTVNLDYIDSLTGKFNLGTADTVGTLELNFNGDEPLLLTMSDTFNITDANNGKVVKTGDGTLQILAADGQVNSHSFVVNSGRLDMKEYFTGSLEIGEETAEGVYSTAIFSPGNSVGSLTINGDFVLNPGSTLLIEQNANGIDTLSATSFQIASDSILDLPVDSLQPGMSTTIIQSTNAFQDDLATDDFWNGLLTSDSAYYWNLKVVNGNTVMASVDSNAVPEPSTWALLILGAAGLMYIRKRNK